MQEEASSWPAEAKLAEVVWREMKVRVTAGTHITAIRKVDGSRVARASLGLAEAELLQRAKRRKEYVEHKFRSDVAIGGLTFIAAVIGLSIRGAP